VVIRAGILGGFDEPEACSLVGQVRRVLDRLARDSNERTSRVELAAQLLGSSHALDAGTRLEAAVARALRLRLGTSDSRELWEQSGVHLAPEARGHPHCGTAVARQRVSDLESGSGPG
jgi:hypothetical protein